MLGRRKDIDVRISEDISISRVHAFIQYDPSLKQFKLGDNKSKFGTLVLIKKGLLARPRYMNISFQVGAEVYAFEALRGNSKSDFVLEEGEDNEYFQDYLSDDEDQDLEE